MVVLYRIDNRLIHGQVLQGWLPHISGNLIAVVSDEFSKDALRHDLAVGAAPQGVRVAFWTHQEAVRQSVLIGADGEIRALFIFPAPKDLLDYIDAGGAIPKEINIGGMHYALGRLTLGRFQTFSKEDKAALCRLQEIGVKLDARATPWDDPIDLAPMLMG